MKLGENILKLRKRNGLSQEQLGEQANVTRQTISNWELGETAPNPEQLKLLSKALNVSIDELLDNEAKEYLMKKVSNTEKLAGMIIKILKFFGVIIILYFSFLAVLLIVGITFYTSNKKQEQVEHKATIVCNLDNTDYKITLDNQNFQCHTCSEHIQEELDAIIQLDDINESVKNIEEYFKDKNGTCQ